MTDANLAPTPAGAPGPATAWQALQAGNDRCVATWGASHAAWPRPARHHHSAPVAPLAAVLTCADLVVPVERIFDRAPGEVLVVSTVAHVLDRFVLASLEGAVRGHGAPLVAVLGHEDCAGVELAMSVHASGRVPGGHLREIVQAVLPSVRATPTHGVAPWNTISERHTRATARLIAQRSATIADAVATGACMLLGLGFTPADGRVHPIEVLAAPAAPALPTVAAPS